MKQAFVFKIAIPLTQFSAYLQGIETIKSKWNMVSPIKTFKNRKSFLRKRWYILPIEIPSRKTSLILIMDMQNGIFMGYTFYNRDSATLNNLRKGIFLYAKE